MPNVTTTNIDTGHLVFKDGEFQDDTITLAGADTLVKGTILARDSVSLKLVIFVAGGATNENGIPKAVLMHEVVATGAGDKPARVLVRGTVNKARLVIDADGTAANVNGAVVDQLRSYGITPLDVQQLGAYDNAPG